MRGVIRLLPAGGVWVIPGVDVCPGVVPEQVRCTVDPWGPASLTFTLRRPGDLPWPDLQPGVPVEFEAHGAGLVWSGRVRTAAPTDDGVAVTCEGWQAHLDDDPEIKRLWVHQRLGDWGDIRARTGADQAVWSPQFQVTSGGQIVVGLAANAAVPAWSSGGVVLDGGYAGAIARVVVDWECTASTGGIGAFICSTDTDPTNLATSTNVFQADWTALAASGTWSHTLPTPRRYVMLVHQRTGGAGITPTANQWWKATRIRAFGSTAYESGGESVLRASTVVADALAGAPLLDPSTAGIQTSGLIDAGVRGIPHLTTEGQQESPRAVMTRGNAYHDWILSVGADRRVSFRPRPTVPTLELGAWTGGSFQDAGDTIDELYNRVVVGATDIHGDVVQVTRSTSSPLLALAGAIRAKNLGADAALTVAAAEVIGDAWLSRRGTRPTRGGIQAPGVGALRRAGGGDVAPAEALRYVGELVRLMDRVDPDTGGLGRDATIVGVSYDADTDTAQLQLDAPLDRLDVLLTRFAAISSIRPAA